VHIHSGIVTVKVSKQEQHSSVYLIIIFTTSPEFAPLRIMLKGLDVVAPGESAGINEIFEGETVIPAGIVFTISTFDILNPVDIVFVTFVILKVTLISSSFMQSKTGSE